MMDNISGNPYVLHIHEQPIQTSPATKPIGNLGIQMDPIMQELTTEATLNPVKNPHLFNTIAVVHAAAQSTSPNAGFTSTEATLSPVKNPHVFNTIAIVHEAAQSTSPNAGFTSSNKEQPCVVQIVYPQELNLNPAYNAVKRGRPKKTKSEEKQVGKKVNLPSKEIIKPAVTARTRSGRVVKVPKHIERDFKNIKFTTGDEELQVSDFTRCETIEHSQVEFVQLDAKKRTISAQFRCPKCLKAYLGKNKMIEHLKKYPDHGPLPEGYQEFNFDVWNYLYNITQKCRAGQRGVKFCEELSNLLHNVQLLKNALFKRVTDNKNCVQIDKVLGNAIGLTPGRYKFDENELYKDVTVLKLITNSDFFKPNGSNNRPNNDTTVNSYPYDNLHDEHSQIKRCKESDQTLDEEFMLHNAVKQKNVGHPETESINCPITNIKENASSDKFVTHDKMLRIQESPDKFSKGAVVDTQISLHSELLTENLLLHSLPNSRNSMDELILTSVDNSTNLLDNSTSLDDVMNVDQFVNERFKRIIEPDIELSSTSLSLDLPSLELFQFHTS